jgi:hypothetical protein
LGKSTVFQVPAPADKKTLAYGETKNRRRGGVLICLHAPLRIANKFTRDARAILRFVSATFLFCHVPSTFTPFAGHFVVFCCSW